MQPTAIRLAMLLFYVSFLLATDWPLATSATTLQQQKTVSTFTRENSSSITISIGSRRAQSTNMQLGMSLSGSSSSPVEPIKPLLDLSNSGSEDEDGETPPYPIFDEAAPRNISSMTGNAAYLHCLVHNLGNKSVSWIRQRDLHILTVGRYTYTTDQRYEVIHSQGSKDWILKIKYAQVRDSGRYECQVSTKPVRSYIVELNIYAPQAEIIGAPDMHVDKGSTINLTCVIAHSPEPPAFIFWYHNGKVINYDSPRGGITVVTERGNSTSGYLLIQDARPSDTGNYSCAPSNTAYTTLRVHVLNGETPAAMQTNGVMSTLVPPSSTLLWPIPLHIMLLDLFFLLWDPPLQNLFRWEGGP
ncbi:zwei Ig domain protein zig-8-like [Macrobrachium nipponense]|uniref:zwei Ig domain protein zig-8-like n=1 Tax=Macrobrachium nipponense TaxID=159736 RepID=UPI0030C81C41